MKVLLVGGGRPLFFLAQALRRKGHAVTIVNRDAAECARLAGRIDATIVHGDGTEPGMLEEAGARSARILLAALASDADNLVCCQLARTRFAIPRAIALVNDPDNQVVFGRLGIDALSMAGTIASLIEQRITFDQVTDLIPAGDGRVHIAEVTLDAACPIAGRTIATIGLPRDALIAVVTRDGRTLVPRGDTTLEAGDRVLLVTLSANRGRALAILTGSK